MDAINLHALTPTFWALVFVGINELVLTVVLRQTVRETRQLRRDLATVFGLGLAALALREIAQRLFPPSGG